jgi:hypothetical protein
MRAMLIALSALMVMTLTGCERSLKEDLPVWQSNKRLLEKTDQLENQVRTLEADNKQLKQQVDTLGSIGKEMRLESLYNIGSINIVSSTGIYTKKKGQPPELLVYFSPIDQSGDAIKAAGKLDVELWNIASKENEALIHKWEIGPESLAKHWGTGLMSSFYRVSLQLPENMPKSGDFVVRLSFTDYLSGKILTARQSINKMSTQE